MFQKMISSPIILLCIALLVFWLYYAYIIHQECHWSFCFFFVSQTFWWCPIPLEHFYQLWIRKEDVLQSDMNDEWIFIHLFYSKRWESNEWSCPYVWKEYIIWMGETFDLSTPISMTFLPLKNSWLNGLALSYDLFLNIISNMIETICYKILECNNVLYSLTQCCTSVSILVNEWL